MSETSKYKVDFTDRLGKLVYEDSQGGLQFFYEIAGKSLLHLSSHPETAQGKIIDIENESSAAQERLSLAFERTRQYLFSCGYEIEILPD
jgi:hypothetical protein